MFKFFFFFFFENTPTLHSEFPTELVCNGILKGRNVKRVAEPYRISQQWTLYQLGSEDGFSR